MAGSSVYVIMRNDEIDSIHSTLDAANSAAQELFSEHDESKVKKRKDGSLEITADDLRAVVDVWQVQQGAKKAAASKKTSEAKSKKAAVPKPSKPTGPTVETPSGAKDALEGKVVCVTGTIEGYTRPQIQTVVQNHGGSCVNSITKAVNLVVLGSDAGPKKLDAIEKNGIETVDYDGLIELIEGSGGASKKRRHD